MRSELLDLACCPTCFGQLQLDVTEMSADNIISGILKCQECSSQYPVIDRIPHLYVDDERWLPKAREAKGWVSYHKEMGIYDQAGVDTDFQTPYYAEEPWITVAQHFEVALDLIRLTGKERVLDLGAGRGWAAKQFALRGCRTIALDVVADDQVGLGRSWALMEEAGTYFDPVIGDSENLPFFDKSFDVVFCAAVLHHTADLARLLRNVYRVLRPRGVLCAVNEPCISIAEKEETVLAVDAADELKHGINERRPNLLQYHQSILSAGFTEFEIFPRQAYYMSEDDITDWCRDLGVLFPIHSPISLLKSYSFGRYIRFLKRRWQTRNLSLRRIPANQRQELLNRIMLYCGAETCLIAQK